ncbi:hypothetical protein A4U61_32680 [Streptomyces sp. H-KF8]|nr:hypothetical protein A4U61_32680 [Streptomyces sp. H-KF8]
MEAEDHPGRRARRQLHAPVADQADVGAGYRGHRVMQTELHDPRAVAQGAVGTELLSGGRRALS